MTTGEKRPRPRPPQREAARRRRQADGRRITLKLAEMRAGFVYELRLESLAPGGADFHPAEAHYTLQTVPR